MEWKERKISDLKKAMSDKCRACKFSWIGFRNKLQPVETEDQFTEAEKDNYLKLDCGCTTYSKGNDGDIDNMFCANRKDNCQEYEHGETIIILPDWAIGRYLKYQVKKLKELNEKNRFDLRAIEVRIKDNNKRINDIIEEFIRHEKLFTKLQWYYYDEKTLRSTKSFIENPLTKHVMEFMTGHRPIRLEIEPGVELSFNQNMTFITFEKQSLILPFIEKYELSVSMDELRATIEKYKAKRDKYDDMANRFQNIMLKEVSK